jgi:Ty3 transposon capsid-like protein
LPIIQLLALENIRAQTRRSKLTNPTPLLALLIDYNGVEFVTVSSVPEESPPLSRSPSPTSSELLICSFEFRPPAAMSGPKLNKPPVFTAKNLSLATVNTWIFKIRSYVRETDSDDWKIEIASSFLTETAELWFLAVYGSAATLPKFDEFITAFKKHFSRADDTRELRHKIETMKQGDLRPVLSFYADFITVLAQLGTHDEG